MDLTIYRPYSDPYNTALVLSENDLHRTKYNCFLLIKLILHKQEIISEKVLYDIYSDDPFFKYYNNGNRPYLDFLISYYIAVTIITRKASGSSVDMLSNYKNRIKQIKNVATIEPWSKEQELMHKLFLLNDDFNWYKRHFRECYIYTLNNFDMFINDEPRKVKEEELIKHKDAIMIDDWS